MVFREGSMGSWAWDLQRSRCDSIFCESLGARVQGLRGFRVSSFRILEVFFTAFVGL